ncbi:MAG: pyruvate:ferredoxin (flavodoxin) oxidoreductase [Thermoanaerobaculia bacterium]|nr:pyruvate:ferredoxin (flavodoxin) oxidoreductase [Thermoanaerobaculia bacterium]
MGSPRTITVDGNEAAASVAYRTNEVIAIYPITPASPMGELSDAWAAEGRPNIWGQVPQVVEMQSEGGAAGAVHGALQAGSLTTTFTASQGLLLMIPNMYKIAGELTPFALHVSARTVATHALSIFCDHSDVMAARQTGFALLAASSVQEAHDFALISQAATLASRVPFLHFFDGFRTSHEIQKIRTLADDDLAALIDPEAIAAHRRRALTPDRPVIRGTAQNPDTFFQAREASNPYYDACPAVVQETMERFARRTGRVYRLFDYSGHPEAERVVVLMGSGVETARETAEWLAGRGERVGVLAVRLYRPFDAAALVAALPSTARSLAVLDRTKEPGAPAEPLHLDVVAALDRAVDEGALERMPRVVGGRYGLSSKEFDPACAAAVFAELGREKPRSRFTVGIVDDVTHLSLDVERPLDIEPPDRVRAVFFGLGSDGTVSANKNSIKIIGEETDRHVQAYFVYDSKKAGAVTISHLRFGPEPIRSPYLIDRASLVACHQFDFLERFDILRHAAPGGSFLLNSPYPAEAVWDHMPREVQEEIVARKLDVWVVDAYRVAREAGLGARINTIMQTCFFALSGILPQAEATARIKEAIQKSYGKRGQVLVERNFKAVDATLAGLRQVEVPGKATSQLSRPPIVAEEAPDFVQKVTAVMLANRGDSLPVSAFPVDGTWPTGTTRWEKRNIAREIPLWEPDVCIQCNQCALVCPHAAIRAKVYEHDALAGAPESFLSAAYKAREFRGLDYTIQVAPEDCTGCHLCVEVCPAKDKTNPRRKAINMEPQRPVRERERANYAFFLELPEIERDRVERLDAKGSQFLQPLFEYSGACAGCGETPYVKLLTQLFGDRLLIANATGCSSIYGGNLPTTPYTVNAEGRGPAWSNSLFEDNAEFGLGFRLALDSRRRLARDLVRELAGEIGEGLVAAILAADQESETGIEEQRERVARLREKLAGNGSEKGARLLAVADDLVRKSVWIVGGDGWAYDIGYGGLDHILSSTFDVNILVLDTEVYSNTGGQRSKATPLGAAAKFAASGKEIGKKDLGMEMMSYGHVYVAQVALGAKMNQTVEALREAEAHRGPSLVIAYSPCIAHGYDLAQSAEHQKSLVEAGALTLYRFDPARGARGEPPLKLDSGPPRRRLREVRELETRFRMVEKIDRDRYRRFLARAEREAARQYAVYSQLAGITLPSGEATE